MNIIGISGRAGSGKDTVAEYLAARYNNVWIEHFADPLKRACAAAFGIPLENFSDRSVKEISDPRWLISPRKIAQFVGTEMFRDMMAELSPDIAADFWVQRMSLLLSGHIDTEGGAKYLDEDTIVIPDLRFQNEYKYITDNGGIVIRLLRDEITNADIGLPGHSSEAGFTMDAVRHKAYTIFNSGTKEELYVQVEEMLDLSEINLFRNILVHRTVSTQY